MSYDKYRNWKLDTPMEMNKLKEQVLEDILDSTDQTEQLEFLDSFQAAVERAHTAELAEHLSNQILFIVRPFLIAAINAKLPTSMPIGRPRAAPAPIKEE